jgi:glycosyltransferase involved in cell wall biosynthesis
MTTHRTTRPISRYPARYIRAESGKPGKTRNIGIKAAQGKYIAMLDDDDLWLENRLKPAIDILEKDETAVMVYAQTQYCNGTFEKRGLCFPAAPLEEGHPVKYFLENPVSVGAMLIRKTALEQIGGFDEQTSAAEDIDLAVRIARYGKCLAIQEPVALLRAFSEGQVDPGKSLRGGSARWAKRYHDEMEILKRHLVVKDEYSLSRSQKGSLIRKRNGWYVYQLIEHASKAAAASMRDEARAALILAAKISPLHAARNKKYWSLLLNRTAAF